MQEKKKKTSLDLRCFFDVNWEDRSQHRRMAELGRAFWRHLVQTLLKQGRPEEAAQDHIQVAFEGLQGGGDLWGGDLQSPQVHTAYCPEKLKWTYC